MCHHKHISLRWTIQEKRRVSGSTKKLSIHRQSDRHAHARPNRQEEALSGGKHSIRERSFSKACICLRKKRPEVMSCLNKTRKLQGTNNTSSLCFLSSYTWRSSNGRHWPSGELQDLLILSFDLGEPIHSREPSHLFLQISLR